MTESASIGKCASDSVDANLTVFHVLLCASQDDGLCRWFREGDFPSIAQAWRACAEPEWMADLLELKGHDDERLLRKAALRFLRATPSGDGEIIDLFDETCRDAIAVGQRHADGHATAAELRKAQRVIVVAHDRMPKAEPRRQAARRLALHAAYWALGSSDLFDAKTISGLTVSAAVWMNTPMQEAKRFQADVLRSVFDNPFTS
jgi:hypothetical protein